MNDPNPLVCPACGGNHFNLKYEATYVYSYAIDGDAPGLHNSVEFLPFQYDRREQTGVRQFLECDSCGADYPCFFNDWDGKIGVQALQDAINAGYSPDR